ncbi:MAG: DUF1559 domain-containing protein, partial [Planctomycetales bacterium]
LYQRYRFDEPWDGPNNSQLLPLMPQVFRCPTHGQPGDTVTAFAGVFGPNSVFRGTNGTSFADITDGASNTLSVAEVTTGARIPWMKPEDVDITIHSMLGDPAGFGSHHVGGFNALMLDGSVRFISTSISPTILQGLYTIDGNEQIQDF